MPKRSRSLLDPNVLAKRIVDLTTGEKPEKPPKKNPHAVALGRKGGKKGGKARAAALSPERKREIAKAAAEARWSKK